MADPDTAAELPHVPPFDVNITKEKILEDRQTTAQAQEIAAQKLQQAEAEPEPNPNINVDKQLGVVTWKDDKYQEMGITDHEYGSPTYGKKVDKAHPIIVNVPLRSQSADLKTQFSLTQMEISEKVVPQTAELMNQISRGENITLVSTRRAETAYVLDLGDPKAMAKKMIAASVSEYPFAIQVDNTRDRDMSVLPGFVDSFDGGKTTKVLTLENRRTTDQAGKITQETTIGWKDKGEIDTKMEEIRKKAEASPELKHSPVVTRLNIFLNRRPGTLDQRKAAVAKARMQ